jgi:hypothetical protein
MVANSLSFPMVHKMAPNGCRFVSYGSQKLDRLLNQQFWEDLTSLYKSVFWQNFTMTSLETLYMKNAINKLSFLLVTHTTCFDTRFDDMNFCSQDSVLDRFWIDWYTGAWSGFWATRWVKHARV